MSTSDTDLVKLSVFATFVWNWMPLETMARECNPRAEETLRQCHNGLIPGHVVNFVLTDYPNYPGPGGKTIVELADTINTQRAKSFL
jgi:hypothetical protein